MLKHVAVAFAAGLHIHVSVGLPQVQLNICRDTYAGTYAGVCAGTYAGICRHVQTYVDIYIGPIERDTSLNAAGLHKLQQHGEPKLDQPGSVQGVAGGQGLPGQ